MVLVQFPALPHPVVRKQFITGDKNDSCHVPNDDQSEALQTWEMWLREHRDVVTRVGLVLYQGKNRL